LLYIIFGVDPNPQQTNHAAEPPTGCFLERAAADGTGRSLLAGDLHLSGLFWDEQGDNLVDAWIAAQPIPIGVQTGLTIA